MDADAFDDRLCLLDSTWSLMERLQSAAGVGPEEVLRVTQEVLRIATAWGKARIELFNDTGAHEGRTAKLQAACDTVAADTKTWMESQQQRSRVCRCSTTLADRRCD